MGGEMWKSLPADKKKTYGDRALEAKKKYSAYVAIGKGAAALKAYKDGIAKAKAPLVAKDENLKAKKAAKKEKAKARAAAKKEKVKALKAKAKAKAVAKKAAKKAKPAKKASKKAKVLKKAKKPVKKAKKLIEFVPNVSTPMVAFFGFVSCGAIALALLKVRHS